MIEEFSVEMDNNIKFTFKLAKQIEVEKLDFLNETKTVDDIEKALEKRKIEYEEEISQFGIRFATPNKKMRRSK